ncbi:MAG: T9SS type A sorting domain-containing protein [Cryomorphaceae bacterium]|nr:T9SS type A sorting domain-containing protein [Cryomorphaceae bacterium]
MHGKQVKQVFSGSSESSELHIRVDLSNLAAGSYVYRVQTEIGVRQKKVVVY